MFLPTIISVLVLFGADKVSGTAQCRDCVLLRSCQGAIDYTSAKKNNAEAMRKIRESFCGTQLINGVTAPKVCCSDFTTDNAYDNRWANSDDDLKDAIASHPNLSLLPKSCGGIDGNRIVGGKIANIYEFPWMALISHRTRESSGNDNLQFKCGGSIINSRYILTAAHCVHNKKIAGVRIGEFDIRSKEDCQGEYPLTICESHIQDISVEEVIPHKDYQRTPIENDIALLRLRKPINLTLKNAKPVCLPVPKELRELQITSGDKRGTVTGWGLTETGSESAILRKVNIPILSAVTCREFYNKNLAPGSPDMTLNKICAGEMDKDSCSGDSGGPLMLEDEVDGIYRTIQYGIVSFGPRQCGSLFPGVYTDVTKYIKWILDNMKA
ncbi:unnamed protein product, partial [Brenthis ino]